MERFDSSIIACNSRSLLGKKEERSITAVKEWLAARESFQVHSSCLIGEQKESLLSALRAQASSPLIIVSGSTGIGKGALSPQTIDEYSDYEIPGLGEQMRRYSMEFSDNALLGRCGGWVKDKSLILAVASNPQALCEQLDGISHVLLQAVESLQGKCKGRAKKEKS